MSRLLLILTLIHRSIQSTNTRNTAIDFSIGLFYYYCNFNSKLSQLQNIYFGHLLLKNQMRCRIHQIQQIILVRSPIQRIASAPISCLNLTIYTMFETSFSRSFSSRPINCASLIPPTRRNTNMMLNDTCLKSFLPDKSQILSSQ